MWLKRDDCSGLALGGNKTRKLEFLLGEAVARDASGVVTFGAVQSNHARQTAAACAAVGLPCDLVLTEMVDRATVHYAHSGNRLLDDLLAATVHVVPDNDAALQKAAELAEEDPDRYFIDPGGSTPVGTLGYVAMAAELLGQIEENGLTPGRVIAAASSGGTAAGIVVGLAGTGIPLHAPAVYAPSDQTDAVIGSLVAGTADLLGVDGPAGGWTVTDSTLGPGYGIPTDASRAAIRTLARTEGVLLDPVYTAKAFARLLDDLPALDAEADVVFVHTGGQAGLFAYADEG